MKKRILSLALSVVSMFVIVLIFTVLAGCSGSNANISKDDTQGKAKYVFFFVGDGMSTMQVNAAEIFLNNRAQPGKLPGEKSFERLAFSQFPVTGLTTTHDYGTYITDSASAATAFASGKKTWSNVINIDPTTVDMSQSSRPAIGQYGYYKTIAEYAKEAGFSVGIVSTVTLTHATPAAFYAKHQNRNADADLADQLLKSGFDYFAGGRVRANEDANTEVLNRAATEFGYTVATTPEQVRALMRPLNAGEKVLITNPRIQESGAMPYELDRIKASSFASTTDFSIADYTRLGIELMQNNKTGFFMMIEGGKIDWVGHANDAASNIWDVVALDDAVKVALEFAQKHPKDTLIIVTGDHETGGMTIGNNITGYSTNFSMVSNQNMSYVAFDDDVLNPYKEANKDNNARSLNDLKAQIQNAFGIDIDNLSKENYRVTSTQRAELDAAFAHEFSGDPGNLYGGYSPLTVRLTQIANSNAGLGWTSYAHTGVPVATFAQGVNQHLFAGYYDNTDLFYYVAKAMDITVPAKK